MEAIVIDIVVVLLVVFVGIVAKSGESALNMRKRATGNKGLLRVIIDASSQDGYECPVDNAEQYAEISTTHNEVFAGYTSTYTAPNTVEPEPFLTSELGAVTTPNRGCADAKQQSIADDSSIIEQTAQTVQSENQCSDSESVESNFDLRAAVIYSEILSPKFKDLD